MLRRRAAGLPRAARDGPRRRAGPQLAAVLARPHQHAPPTSTRSSRRSARSSSGPAPRAWSPASARPRRRSEGARARRHVRRCRLRRRRGPRRRRRPRRHRHPPRAVAQPAVLPQRRPRLLHDRGLQRRPPGRRRDRDPVLRLGPERAVPRGRRRGLHRGVRRRPHPQPLPALQREDQVRRRPRPRPRARLRRGRDRPLRPARDRRRRRGRDAPRGRPGQGPVLRARRARPRSSSRTRCSRSAARPSRRCATEAERRGLQVAQKPDSHDICFIADGDTAGWLRERLGAGAGAIVDHATGEVLGTHEGSYGFTIGQRKGLRIGRPTADGRPRFVLDIEPVSGTVTVGPREALTVDRVEGIRPRWCGAAPTEPLHGTVQLRAHGEEHRAVVTVTGDRGGDRAARPGAGHRPRPGRGRVRRPAGRRLLHDRRDLAHHGPGVIAASGVGSMPGDDTAAFEHAVRVVLEELPDLPHVPEVPGRGAHASMTGRSLAVRRRPRRGPAARRLAADRGTGQQRRRPPPGAARCSRRTSTWSRSSAQGYAGRFKIQVAGPWTLAATVERPRGDRVLADHGARRELAQALAEGLRGHVADVRRRIPDAELLVQVDEPALPAVLARPGADGVRLPPAPDGAPAGRAAPPWSGCSRRSARPVPPRSRTAARPTYRWGC